MESSHIFGDAEECHSSESGWTMYIGSPIDSDDGGDEDGDDRSDDGDDNDGDCDDHSVKRDEDSDDSMASDASSGPNHRGHSWGNGKEHHQVDKKAKKPVEMEKSENARRKQEKEKSVFATKGTNVGTESSSDKVRKNSWYGKRK